jgi:hypothetical protein
MKNFHIIKVKYLGPTNTKGSRVKMVSERFVSSKTISYDYKFNSAVDMAADWLTNTGFNIIGQAEGTDCGYIITDTFEELKA